MNGGRRTRAQAVPIDTTQRHTIRKTVVGLTEFERQLLLKELAEIQAELDELKFSAVQLPLGIEPALSA